MFHRSRRKIVLSIMGSLILLFAVALSVILLASYREIRQRNGEMLERYVELYSLEQQTGSDELPELDPEQEDSLPAGKPDDPQGQPSTDSGSNDPAGAPPSDRRPDDPAGRPPLDRGPDYQLFTFYSAALAEDGSVLAVDVGDKELYSEEDLIRIAKEILEEDKASGRTDHLT